MACELEIVVREGSRRLEADQHEPIRVVAGARDGDGEEGAASGPPGHVAPWLVEASILEDVRGREHVSINRGAPQDARRLRQAVGQGVHQLLRQTGPTGKLERRSARHQHRRERAAERFARRLGHGVEGRLERERLAEHGRDQEEAALDLRLSCPRVECLRVRQSERREACVSLEQLDVLVVEVALAAGPDTKHSLHVVAESHRPDESAGEARVRIVRNGLFQRVVGGERDRPPRLQRPARQPPTGGKLESDEIARQSEDSRAAEHVAV